MLLVEIPAAGAHLRDALAHASGPIHDVRIVGYILACHVTNRILFPANLDARRTGNLALVPSSSTRPSPEEMDLVLATVPFDPVDFALDDGHFW